MKNLWQFSELTRIRYHFAISPAVLYWYCARIRVQDTSSYDHYPHGTLIFKVYICNSSWFINRSTITLTIHIKGVIHGTDFLLAESAVHRYVHPAVFLSVRVVLPSFSGPLLQVNIPSFTLNDVKLKCKWQKQVQYHVYNVPYRKKIFIGI